MENEPEKMTDRTAAPGSQTSPDAPKQVVVNNGFDKLFFALSIPFIVVSLSLVSLFVILGIDSRTARFRTRFRQIPDRESV